MDILPSDTIGRAWREARAFAAPQSVRQLDRGQRFPAIRLDSPQRATPHREVRDG